MAEFQIEMYGVFRRLAQTDKISLNMDADKATVDSLLDRLASQFPDMSDTLKVTAVAIGDELVTRDQIISPSDSLALIPPVSGG